MADGYFISLDGIDGGGKSTQCQLLLDWFSQNGHPGIVCRDPGGTTLGEKVRSILLSKNTGNIDRTAEMLLYMASRAQLTTEVIQPALKAGQIVISDRYLLANVVYQGYGGGLDVDALWKIGHIATGGLDPDLTFILDLPYDQARKRQQSERDRMESLPADFFSRVQGGFLHEASKQPEKISVIPASRSIQAIHAQIVDIVSEQFPMYQSNS